MKSSDLPSTRLKALTITAGFSLWFFIITSATDTFTWEIFAIFVIVLLMATQILAQKITRVLEVFAAINTKVFLGIAFIFVFSVYGLCCRLLRIDLLRLKQDPGQATYWLPMEAHSMQENIRQF